jgi:hypothetical protein
MLRWTGGSISMKNTIRFSITILLFFVYSNAQTIDSCFSNICKIDTVTAKIVRDDPKMLYLWRMKSLENDTVSKKAFSDYNLRQSKANRNLVIGSIAYSISWVAIILLSNAADNDNNGKTGIPGWVEYSIGIPIVAINITGLMLLIPGGLISKYFKLNDEEQRLYCSYRICTP